jgi:hypothetical protein
VTPQPSSSWNTSPRDSFASVEFSHTTDIASKQIALLEHGQRIAQKRRFASALALLLDRFSLFPVSSAIYYLTRGSSLGFA